MNKKTDPMFGDEVVEGMHDLGFTHPCGLFSEASFVWPETCKFCVVT
jgi:hypothetical protein